MGDVMLKKSFQNCFAWHTAHNEPPASASVCSTRDVFQGKLDNLHCELSRKTNFEKEAALFVAVMGEIGGNCFDHNLGQWQDIPGCWFQNGMDEELLWILIADRGQGILSSLRKVEPALQTDQDALEIAFSKKISGRSPERRGNGLKFVRSIINGDPDRGLLFISGKGAMIFGGLVKPLQDLQKGLNLRPGTGTFACILWNCKK